MQNISSQIQLHTKAIRLLSKIIAASNPAERNKAKHNYAEHMEKMTKQHVEAAAEQLNNEQLVTEIFAAAHCQNNVRVTEYQPAQTAIVNY